MALPSAFGERLEQMEQTRRQRLSLLQAEKELQINKSQLLASKFSNIRAMEQRCLKLDHKMSSQHFIISSLKSEIDRLDSKYINNLLKFRVLKSEVEELEELEKEKEKFYGLKSREMDEFKAQVKNYAVECKMRVQELRSIVNEPLCVLELVAHLTPVTLLLITSINVAADDLLFSKMSTIFSEGNVTERKRDEIVA